LPYFRQIASRSLPKYSRILQLLCFVLWVVTKFG
jgi:hypothetical protein